MNTYPDQTFFYKHFRKLFPFIVSIFLLTVILEYFYVVQTAECAKAIVSSIQAVKIQEDIHLNAVLEGAFNKDITEAVSSGAPTRFRFLIRIKKKRGFWFDKEIKEFTLYHTVTYDVLKKEYMANKSYPNGTEENLSTSDWDEMVQWMTKLTDVHLSIPDLKDQNAKYYLSIRAEMKCIKIPFPLNYLLAFVALWNFDTPWARTPLKVDSKQPEMIEHALIDDK